MEPETGWLLGRTAVPRAGGEGMPYCGLSLLVCSRAVEFWLVMPGAKLHGQVCIPDSLWRLFIFHHGEPRARACTCSLEGNDGLWEFK